MNPSLVNARELVAHYGSSKVLFGASLEIQRGEFVTLLGRNGMGKSTLVKVLLGMLPPSSGSIVFDGVQIAGRPDYENARRGIGLVPEGRGIFPNLTVRENLLATEIRRESIGRPWTLERVYGMFPRLQEREKNLGSDLSGGEQQMLAIGRALMTNPKLLILDEATEGLAPLVRREIWLCLKQIKSEGLTMLVIDKNLKPLLHLADRHYVIDKGSVAWTGTSSQLQAAPEVLSRYLSM
ncbi:MAG: ABC transporter ATP-binding protein [Polaromonas sp.]|uniref:ABC transporter ATP-binding protein n=1 Tax=Polaromonas sp. TaxID=1869339 RepID=UPI00403552B0